MPSRNNKSAKNNPSNIGNELYLNLLAVIDSLPDMVIIADLTGNIMYSNPAHYETMGYDPKEMMGKSAFSYIYSEDVQTVMNAFSAGFKTKTTVKIEYRSIHKNGEIFFVASTGTILESPNGTSSYIVIITRDITNRIRMEKELSAQKARLNSILSASPAVIYAAAPSGNFSCTFISENVRNLLGYEPGIFTGNSSFWAEHIHPDDAEDSFKTLLPVFSRGFHSHEYRFMKNDGSFVWIRDDLHLIRDSNGNPSELIGSLTDITERKNTEAKLKKSEKLYRTIAESTRDNVFLLDLDGRVMYNNKWLPENLHIPSEEITEKHLSEIIPNEDFALATADVVRSKEPFSKQIEMLIQGKLRWFDIQFVPVTNGESEVFGVMGVFRDITQLKQDKEKIITLNDKLKIQNRDLEKQKTLALASEKTKSEFLANMSHEFVTPLNSVIGFTQLILDGLTGEISEKQRDYLMCILESGESLLSLAKNLIDLSDLDLTSSVLERSRFRVRDLIKSAAVSIQRDVLSKNMQASFHVDDAADIVISADALKLQTALGHLVKNAVKFTEENGKIEIAARTINISGENEIRNLEITVSDTGSGIKEEDLPKLFKSVGQIDSPYNKQFRGAGVGLVLVKKLIELHGGTVCAASNYGKGSTFTITMPIDEMEQEKEREKSSLANHP